MPYSSSAMPVLVSEPFYDQRPAQALLDRHRRISYPYRCRFGQAALEIDEDVFCPQFTQTSSLLLNWMNVRSSDRVLDVFTGSGALGINAALQGARVVTVDVSMSAVICARKNAKLNSVDERMDVRWGTMRDCIDDDETFDVIIANPPLLPGRQPDSLSMAIFDPGLRSTVDFLHRVGQHLTEDATCYLLTSSVIERLGVSLQEEILVDGLTSSVMEELKIGYETYRVHAISRRS